MKDMLGDVINGVIGPIFDATWNSLKVQYHEGLHDTELKQEHIKAQQAINRASKNYHQKYLDIDCKIKLFGNLMPKGIPLESIYTAVKFLSNSDLKYFEGLDNLEELYRKTGSRNFRIGQNERQDGLTVANTEQYLMVLGGPGIGKSTFLRKLGLEALTNRLAYDLMPVFVELKYLKGEDKSLLKAIAKKLEISGFPYSERLLESMLLEGKMLILLDGLDEVPTKQKKSAITEIESFCNQHSQNRFVISCRTASYKGGFDQFYNVTMAEFDDKQIQPFIQRWFNSDLDLQLGTAEKVWKALKQSENASVKELARTPLLLAFLCLKYEHSQSLISNRSNLYGKVLDILLEEWAASKRIEQDIIYQGLHTGLEKVLLSRIAYQSFKEDQLFFSEQGITEQITEFLADTLDAPKHLDGAAVLHAIEIQQGILVEQATDAYSFSHLTLQEYLTARYISKKNLMQELVNEYLTDERWREVFLLVSGLLEDRSQELWILMEQQANAFISSLKLQELFRWVMMCLSDKAHLKDQIPVLRALLLASAIDIASAIRISHIDIIKIGSSSEFSGNFLPSGFARDIINVFVIVSISIVNISDVENFDDIAKKIISYIILRTRDNSICLLNFISGIERAKIQLNTRKNAVAITDILAEDIFKPGIGCVGSWPDVSIEKIGYVKKLNNTNSFLRSVREWDAIQIDTDITRIIAIISSSNNASKYNAFSQKLEYLKAKIPSHEDTPAQWLDFAIQLIDTFLTSFDLDKDLVNFSLEEAQSLEKYLYSVKLIIDCKNAAVRVSRKEWKTIESRLLTVPQDN